MKKMKISDQSDEVQEFIKAVLRAGGVVIEDDGGRMRGSFMPYREPSIDEIKQADAALERVWKKTASAMRKQGATVKDVESLLEADG